MYFFYNDFGTPGFRRKARDSQQAPQDSSRQAPRASPKRVLFWVVFSRKVTPKMAPKVIQQVSNKPQTGPKIIPSCSILGVYLAVLVSIPAEMTKRNFKQAPDTPKPSSNKPTVHFGDQNQPQNVPEKTFQGLSKIFYSLSKTFSDALLKPLQAFQSLCQQFQLVSKCLSMFALLPGSV